MTGSRCPQWGNALVYDDCEECPIFKECMTMLAMDSTRFDGAPDYNEQDLEIILKS